MNRQEINNKFADILDRKENKNKTCVEIVVEQDLEIERLNKELEQRTKQYENALKRYQDLENQNAQTEYSNKKAIEYIEDEGISFLNIAGQRTWCGKHSADDLLKILKRRR